jgi:rRNA maturation endonuclease Nob1
MTLICALCYLIVPQARLWPHFHCPRCGSPYPYTPGR